MKILVLIWVVLLLFSFTTSNMNTTRETYTLTNATNLAKPGCESRCGNLIVPYPFGIGINSNCSMGRMFDLHCNTSSNPPKAVFSKSSSTSVKLISDSTLRTSNRVAVRCYDSHGNVEQSLYVFANSTDSPYTYSEKNKFTLIGCNDYAWLTSETKSRNVSTGCIVFCPKQEDSPGGECSGNGCCQSSIPNDIRSLKTKIRALQKPDSKNDTRIVSRCTYAFIGEENVFKYNGAKDLNDESFVARTEASVPVVLEWAIGHMSCPEAEATPGFACQSNSRCINSTRESRGYRCICKEGYQGNSYLFPGCQDINECNDGKNFPCYGTCVNTVGNYTCKCKQGYYGDAKIKDGCRRKPLLVLLISLGVGLSFLAIVIGLSVLYFIAKKRNLVKLREKFFEQNGGVLLEEKLKNKSGMGVSSMKIFCVKELEEATENYAEDRIMGRGGNGIVYKGTLQDKRVVAIKKSQRLDQGQREQFINEMVILTQINHQNVVQLLGCCLETDVPLLVYEFVPNDTLYHHIHKKTSAMSRLSWDNRLRIAHESARALSYLHTDARMSIIHRDVKSSNILLDDSYTAKIADFGASRLVPLGHDQVTTLVQGTFGYLDPEYFHTGQLTDKSDVYSFGVVLAELLTGMKPLNTERRLEERNLATYFVMVVKENRLHQIIEPQVEMEATTEQLKATADLVCRCLNLVGGNRPSMKEVTMELETLLKLSLSKEIYNEMSSFMIEGEQTDLCAISSIANIDTFGEYSSSSTATKDIMLQVQSPR